MVTCFDEVNAIDVALTSLRHSYPEEQIVVFCEGEAKDFFHLREKHKILVYKALDTQSSILKLSDSNYTLQEVGNVELAMEHLLFRIDFASKLCNSVYMVLHCPDTLIRGKIEIPNGSGLLGSKVNPYFFEKTNQVLFKYGGIPVKCFGAVPAIFNVEDFQKAYRIIKSKPTLIRELAESTCYAFSHDIFMSCLFSLIGKTEEYNPQIVECGRNPDWMNTDRPIVHQFRTFYPKRKTKYKSQENA